MLRALFTETVLTIGLTVPAKQQRPAGGLRRERVEGFFTKLSLFFEL